MHRKLALLLGITIMSSVATKSPEAYTLEFSKVITKQQKLIGTTRYETAIKVSEQGWSNGATNVVLVSGTAIADALSATPFANAINAPILLTQKDSLNKETRTKLKELATKNVYIVGGEGVVSKNIEEELKEDGITVDRIYGATRESTALEVAKRLNKIKPITEVAVVNGYIGLADAVSIAAVAANKDMPIILSSVDNLSSEIDKFIKSNNINNSYIIGGEGVISTSLESKLPNAKRISGQTRKETNAKVIETFYKNNELDNIYVSKDGMANESQLIDALAVGVLAAKNNSPILLVSNNLNNTQEDIINTKSFKSLTQVGGDGNEVAFDQLIDIQLEKVYNVSTIDELNKAIDSVNANDTINVDFDKMTKINEDITISTNKKISLNLKGTYNNTIVIASENLTLSNEGKVKNIVVQGTTAYNSINFINNGIIENLTIKNGSKINVKNSGEIRILTNNSSQAVITGSGSINKPENPSNPEAPVEPESPDTKPNKSIEEINKLIEKIDSSIILEDENSLDEIEKSLIKIDEKYNLLNEDEKQSIINYEKVEKAKKDVEIIKKQLHEVYNAIIEIPEKITLDNLIESEAAVTKAERLYKSLDDKYKKGITPTKLSIIIKSREDIKRLREDINSEKINELIEKIDSTITLENENSLDQIEKNLVEIEKRYSLLSEDEKKSIENYEKLQKAKEDVEVIRMQLYAVFRAIFEIPEEITLDNLTEAEAAVTKAEKAYEALKPEHRKGVMSTELSIITRSRNKINYLKRLIDNSI